MLRVRGVVLVGDGSGFKVGCIMNMSGYSNPKKPDCEFCGNADSFGVLIEESTKNYQRGQEINVCECCHDVLIALGIVD